MGGLIYHLGRGLGYATIPALRKSKQVWRSLAGREGAAIRAEAEFGQSLAAELRLKSGIDNDLKDTALLAGVLGRLSPCVRNKTRRFRVEILRQPAPAALALPGGFLFVTGALLDLCGRDEEALAFILGHEMAHVIRGQAMERMQARVGSEGLSALVSRGLLNPALRESPLDWLEMAYESEAELDADEFGARVARAAGYQSAGAFRWLENLRQWRDSSQLAGNYLTSHPPEHERMAHIRSVLKSKP